jgi:ABC-type nitrate/sulfonate/bicarbonate transport system substrate-binding protein
MTDNQVKPEKTELTIGYMPLTDSLPLLAAESQGFFKAQGLSVELRQEVSWANIRDKLLVGQFDAAQMLSPMLLATHLGLGGLKKAMCAPFSMALNGNAFTISTTLGKMLRDRGAITGDSLSSGKAIKTLVSDLAEAKEAPLLIATVYPYSIHSLLLRDWLSANRIDPDRDVNMVVLPPSQMVDHLKLEHIDGFVAGAPWNTVAIQQNVGECLVTGHDLWRSAPDKVLGMTQDWADKHPGCVQALIRALDQSCEWLEAHRTEAATLISNAIGVDIQAALPALNGRFIYRHGEEERYQPNMLVFHQHLANYPWPEHCEWFIEQMTRWQWIGAEASANAKQMIQECYRGDLYCQALGKSSACNEQLRFDRVENWQIGEISMAPTNFSYR